MLHATIRTTRRTGPAIGLLTGTARTKLIGPMCNLYSITTNQAAIAAPFRVVNPLRRQPCSDAGRISGSSLAGDTQHFEQL